MSDSDDAIYELDRKLGIALHTAIEEWDLSYVVVVGLLEKYRARYVSDWLEAEEADEEDDLEDDDDDDDYGEE